MCASYGLQIRASDLDDYFGLSETAELSGFPGWMNAQGQDAVKPTGRIARNLNPIVQWSNGGAELDLGWWGMLVRGVPAKWPSINARSERVLDQPKVAKRRALVPATEWFEFQKPSKQRWSFSTGSLFAMAALSQSASLVDGTPVTCYSIITQPARPDLEGIHDRMPLLLPQSFFEEWISGPSETSADLVGSALEAGQEATRLVEARPS